MKFIESQAMIIVRSPLRVTFGGGGTDLPSYYEQHGGFLISAAINKYVYVTLTKPFTPGGYLKYSQIEKVRSIDEIRHPIIREALRLMNLETLQIEITTLSDIPSGTGLGSSGSFTVALLKALHAMYRINITQQELAEMACKLEIEILKEPIGKQDQYISAIGGITEFSFNKDGGIKYSALPLGADMLYNLEDNLLLFFTGFSRSASSILKNQNDRSFEREDEILRNLNYVKQLGLLSRDALISGDLLEFGRLMNEHWQNKKKRSGSMSNTEINRCYDYGINNGAIGGKIVGAGGGGFLMFVARDVEKLRLAMKKVNLEEVRFKFDFDGVQTLMNT
jgi:D-glycero-alpha-D-manno-heptose-7-phosphate kinase